jgi:hypothetical protein
MAMAWYAVRERAWLQPNRTLLCATTDGRLTPSLVSLCQICAIKFADGKAHFRSKYVKTTGYVMEKKAKKLIFKGTFLILSILSRRLTDVQLLCACATCRRYDGNEASGDVGRVPLRVVRRSRSGLRTRGRDGDASSV